MMKPGLSCLFACSLVASCGVEDAGVPEDLGTTSEDGPGYRGVDLDFFRPFDLCRDIWECEGHERCPFGTKQCGVLGTNPPRLRCIPNDFCCTNNDCQATNQTCQIDGTCMCPQNQRACLTSCIPLGACCTAGDCPSKVCLAETGTCAGASCGDGVLNGLEADVDCGGLCGSCAAGHLCAGASDCRGHACVGNRCVDAGFAVTSYGGGSGPVWVTSADFNGDGRPDIATANAQSNNATILLGRGDGSFDVAGSFAAGGSPAMIASGDLDSDGRADLVVVNQGSLDVTVLMGRGDGTFATGVSYVVGGAPTWVAIADLNGDRRLDLVVANSASNSVSVLLGKGDGGFAPKQDYPTAINPRAVEAGDLNGDGLADLVVACRNSSRISILLNRSRGGVLDLMGYFSTVSSIGPNALAIADYNGDRKVDVIAGSAGDGIQIFLGGGNGQIVLAGPGGSGEHNQVIPIDVNRDNILDLVTTNGAFLGNGNGSFGPQIMLPRYANLASIAVADFTGDLKDGRLDVAFPLPDGTVVSLRGTQDGSFEPLGVVRGMESGTSTDITLFEPRAAALRDLDGDGRDDVLIASARPALLFVRLANRDGSLQQASVYTIAGEASAIATGDFDEDKRADVIVGSAAGVATLLLNAGNGTLAPAGMNGMPPPVKAPNVTAMQAGDIDGDRHLDLVFSDASATWVLFGRGDGTFRNDDAPLWTPALALARTLQLVDWNGDGHLDLVSADGAACAIAISKGGDGRGGFLGFEASVPVPLLGGARPSAVFAADLDGDRFLDVVVADDSNYGNPRVEVYLNTGLGNLGFRPGVSYRVASAPFWMAMADLDGDQLLDVATANSLDRSVSTLSGRRDGTFANLLSHDVGFGPSMIAAGDVNGDGRADLVTADRNTVTVLINQP